jgi:hypothetical protein
MRDSIALPSWGSCRFSQSTIRSSSLISSNGWSRGSAHTPIEIGPEESGMSQTQ